MPCAYPALSGGEASFFNSLLGYTLRPMAEKTNVPAATVAQYQEQLSEYREKLEWVRDYL